MTAYTPPPHLRLPVDLLIAYLSRGSPTKPFVAIGDAGVGRGYAIDRVLEAHEYVPYWLRTATSAPSNDMNGRAFFPVYDIDVLDKVDPDALTVPSILLVPSDWTASGDFKGVDSAYFPPPPVYEVERFLVARGYPKELANGNPTYAAALMAMRGWDAAKVHVSIEPVRPTGWDEFRSGGMAPVDDNLLAYYASENLPRSDRRWNHVLWLRRHIPGWLFDRALDEMRRTWPKKVVFPSILRVKKDDRRASPAVPTVTDLPPKPKAYVVDW